jgi:hypothetical protein
LLANENGVEHTALAVAVRMMRLVKYSVPLERRAGIMPFWGLLYTIVDYVWLIVVLTEKSPCERGIEEGDRKNSVSPVIASRSEAIQPPFLDCHGAEAPRNDGLSRSPPFWQKA